MDYFKENLSLSQQIPKSYLEVEQKRGQQTEKEFLPVVQQHHGKTYMGGGA